MSLLDRARSQVRANPGRVILPEAEDLRIVEASQRLQSEGLATVVDVATARPAEVYVDLLLANRPSLKPTLALRMLDKPLIRAAAMVAAGEADALVAGASSATRRVIEAATLAIGMTKGVRIPSSFFLMLPPDAAPLIFADCAVNIDPDAQALADIARASAASAEALLGEARVALLSYSTGTSGAGPSVDRVQEAAQLSGFPGPVQADAALSATIAAKKGYEGGVANTLIFPDLDAGNIAYKLMQELGRAQALGPFLQGFAKPVCDLSRGASVQDIVDATTITLALRNQS